MPPFNNRPTAITAAISVPGAICDQGAGGDHQKREKAKKIAALRAEIWKNAPPIDFKAPLDSLDIMEGVMRHFYFRAMIERAVGSWPNWDKVDALMLKTLAAAEKVARYKHAQLSSVRLAGDISGKMDDVTLDELLVTIKQQSGEARAADRPGPQPVIVITRRGESIASNRERERTRGDFAARRRSPGMGVSSA